MYLSREETWEDIAMGQAIDHGEDAMPRHLAEWDERWKAAGGNRDA